MRGISNERTNGKQRVVYFDVLRSLSTFLVILLHTCAYCYGYIDISSPKWRVINLFRSLSSVGVPLFIMISGALFLNSECTYKRMMSKIIRIITAFFFWSMIYTVNLMVNGSDWTTAFHEFFRGCYHMWFCQMIVGLYLITPFLKLIVESEMHTYYYLLLSFVFVFLLPQLNDIFLQDITRK